MTTLNTRAFAARLAGTAIFDPNGEQLGKIRDVVVTLRTTSIPRVHGLVLEVPPHRRIFLPMTRVTGIDAGQVVATGSINLRRFEPKSGETLVVAELFDRKLTHIPSGEQVTILDVGIDMTRHRNWVISKLFVRKQGSGFRRRGETLMIDWDEVEGLTSNVSEQPVDALLDALNDMRPADVAHTIQTLPYKRQLEIARGLDDDRLADVLEELPDRYQVAIMAMLDDNRAADVLDAMDPGDAADLLNELKPERAEELLQLIEPTDAEDLRRLRSYDEKSAGGMMTTEPVIVPPDSTVAEALAHVRNPELPTSLAAQVLVARPPLDTPTGHFLGMVHFQRMLREPPGTLVSALIDGESETISPEGTLAEVVRSFATYNLVGLPVVDDSHHVLGIVTVDDVIDHMLPEDWREKQDEPAEENWNEDEE